MPESPGCQNRRVDGGPDRQVFVGRGPELALLRDAIAVAANGSGGVILVSGPAGIGKSRLVAEAVRAGRRVVRGRCVADGGAPPLWPWLRILGRVRPELPLDETAAGADATWEGDPRESAAAQFRLLIRWCDALFAAAAADPGLVVVIEDLHDTDDASLALLRHLAAEAADSRLLVIGTLRDVGRARETPTVVAQMARMPAVQRVLLGPLTAAEVGQYLDAAGVDPGLAGPLHDRCAGLPLLVVTMTRLLAAAEPGPADAAALPPLPAAGVEAFISELLGGLGTAIERTAQTAAILGEDVDPRLLADVGQLAIDDVVQHLDVLVAAGFLVTTDELPGRYRFVHALIRDGLAKSARDAACWHRRAAVTLESRVGTDPAQAGRIAAHWARAGTEPVAMRATVRWTLVAAAHAMRMLALQDAIRLLGRALTALGQVGCGPAERSAVLADLARAEYLGGRIPAALTHLREAAAAAEVAGRADLLTGAALVINGAGDPRVLVAAAGLCDRALLAVDDQSRSNAFGDPQAILVARARLTARKACLEVEADELGDVGSATGTALRLAEDCGDRLALLDAARARAGGLTRPGDVAERGRLGELTARVGRESGYVIAAVRGHVWRIDAAYQLVDLAGADEQITRLGELAASSGLPTAQWFHLRVCAARSALVGRFAQARSESAAAGVLALRLNDPVACAVTDQFTVLLALARGDRTQVPNGPGPTAESFPPIPMFQAAHALQLHLLGQQAQAQAGYEHLRLLLTRPLRGVRGLGVLLYLTELVEVFGDAEAAGWASAHWLPWVATGGLPGNAEYFCPGGPARAVGRMAAIKGELDDAEAALRVAASVNTQLNAQPWLTHTWLALAQVLSRRGGTARLTEAATLAGRAAAQARRLDQPGPLGAADTLLAALTTQRRVSDPLTSREHEVADLLAAAMSNRQIAERLVLSERTVESHVHNILRKMGVANRTQLTAHLLGGQH